MATEQDYYDLVKENTGLQRKIQDLNLEIYDLKVEIRDINKRLDDCETRCKKLEDMWLQEHEERLGLEAVVIKMRGQLEECMAEIENLKRNLKQ